MNGNMVKSDFENLFLAEEGENFSLHRDGNVIGEIRGIVLKGKVQCKADTDVQAKDILVSDLRQASFQVTSINPEVVGGVVTCLVLSVVPR